MNEDKCLFICIMVVLCFVCLYELLFLSFAHLFVNFWSFSTLFNFESFQYIKDNSPLSVIYINCIFPRFVTCLSSWSFCHVKVCFTCDALLRVESVFSYIACELWIKCRKQVHIPRLRRNSLMFSSCSYMLSFFVLT